MIPLVVPAALKALPWRLIGAVALVLAVALAGWRVTLWHQAYRRLDGIEAALAAERECQPDTRCAERVRAWQAEGRAAVETARQAAQDAAQAEQDRMAADARAEAERLAAAATAAQAKADAWRRRYEAAIRTDQACREWSAQPLRCPSQ